MEGRLHEMSDEQRQLAIDLYIRGEKYCQSAEIFSVDKSTVSKLVIKNIMVGKVWKRPPTVKEKVSLMRYEKCKVHPILMESTEIH